MNKYPEKGTYLNFQEYFIFQNELIIQKKSVEATNKVLHTCKFKFVKRRKSRPTR